MIEFKKIDLPFAIDIIAEKFDNILELAHPNTFVYGGALRDIIAGLPLEGDLDLVAAGRDYDSCILNISNSGKWRSRQTSIKELAIRFKESNYEGNKAISGISAFETFGNRKVEVIQAKDQFPEYNLTSALEVVKAVDIRCCGIAMDIYGNAYEILKGARQDCLDRVLKLNKLNSNSNIENLKNRIAKLEKRGWVSKINVEKASKTLEKLKKAAEKEFLSKMSKMKVTTHNPRIRVFRKSDHVSMVLEGVDGEMIDTSKISNIIKKITTAYDRRIAFQFKRYSSRIVIEIGPARNVGDLEALYRYILREHKALSQIRSYLKGKSKSNHNYISKGGVIARKNESKFKGLKKTYSTDSTRDMWHNIDVEVAKANLRDSDEPPRPLGNGLVRNEPLGYTEESDRYFEAPSNNLVISDNQGIIELSEEMNETEEMNEIPEDVIEMSEEESVRPQTNTVEVSEEKSVRLRTKGTIGTKRRKTIRGVVVDENVQYDSIVKNDNILKRTQRITRSPRKPKCHGSYKYPDPGT